MSVFRGGQDRATGRTRAAIFLVQLVPAVAFAIVSVGIVGCGPGSGKSGGSSSRIQVATYGTLRGMVHEGKTAGAVALRDGLNYPHAYAVGALAGLAGEITVVDRQAWISRVEGDKVQTTTTDVDALAPSDSAALLVVANAANWKAVPIKHDVPDERLDHTIDELARSAGRDTRAAFPFVIDGPIAELQYHILNASRLPGTGSADSVAGAADDAERSGGHRADGAGNSSHDDHAEGSVRGEVPETRTARLIGFYSQNHQGVFTHMGSDTHVHVILPDSNVTGHVDHVRLRAGAVLRIPK